MNYEAFISAVNEMAQEAHKNAVEHGFYENVPSLMERFMLMVTELAEAAEEVRRGNPTVYYYCSSECGNFKKKCVSGCELASMNDECIFRSKKPEGIASELADNVIRVLDTCAEQGINIGALIVEKHQYNKTRPYMHGGKIL